MRTYLSLTVHLLIISFIASYSLLGVEIVEWNGVTFPISGSLVYDGGDTNKYRAFSDTELLTTVTDFQSASFYGGYECDATLQYIVSAGYTFRNWMGAGTNGLQIETAGGVQPENTFTAALVWKQDGGGENDAFLNGFDSGNVIFDQATRMRARGASSNGGMYETRFIIQKSNADYYISADQGLFDPAARTPGTVVITPTAVDWYAYDPETALDAIGATPVSITLDNITAVGIYYQGTKVNANGAYFIRFAVDVNAADPPTGVNASDGVYEDHVAINWSAPPNATKFTVYRNATDDTATAADISGEITVTNFSDTTAVLDQVYYYWIKAGYSYGWSDFSAPDTGFRQTAGVPAEPQNVSASDGTFPAKVVVTWDAVSNATRYSVYRNSSNVVMTATDISGDITTAVFEDTAAVQDSTYYYWVKAGNAAGWSIFSQPDYGFVTPSVLAYDGFDYPAGSDIVGKDGGLGWGPNTWTGPADGSVTMSDTGLEYDIVTSSGNALDIRFTNNAAFTVTRTLGTPVGGDGTSIWVSWMVHPVVQEFSYFLSLNIVDNVLIGRQWAATKWSILAGSQRADTPVLIETNTTYFMVVRIDFAEGNETVHYWVNPSIKSEPVVENAATITAGNFMLSSLKMRGRGVPDHSVIYDEIRVGNTWKEVAPTLAATDVTASDGTYDDKVEVTWQQDGSATKFVVLRNDENDSSSASDISGEITATNFNDTTASAGDIYYYWVRAGNAVEWFPLSYSDMGYRAVSGAPDPPENVQASDGTEETGVRITWDATSGATKYEVYRNATDSIEGQENISGDVTATEFQDTEAVPGRIYYYRVRAGNASGWSFFSDSDGGFVPGALVAYYALDELEGTNALDSSENECDGVYEYNPTLGVNSVNPDLYNTAVNFEDSWVRIFSNTPIRLLTNNLTVAMWVKPEDLSLQGDQRLLACPQGSGGGWFTAINAGRIKFTTWGVKDYLSTGMPFQDNKWTHIAATMYYDNSVQFYVSGDAYELPKAGPAPAVLIKTDTYIGDDGTSIAPFYGSIDEVRVYDGALSREEILELAQIPEPGILLIAFAAFAAMYLRR